MTENEARDSKAAPAPAQDAGLRAPLTDKLAPSRGILLACLLGLLLWVLFLAIWA